MRARIPWSAAVPLLGLVAAGACGDPSREALPVGKFFDDFYASGVIPTVLVRWEMTGEKDAILDGPIGFGR
jgi:hypothetical protein